MATPLVQSVPRLETPLTDPKTGLITTPWYMLIITLFNRTGGSAATAATMPTIGDTVLQAIIESGSDGRGEGETDDNAALLFVDSPDVQGQSLPLASVFDDLAMWASEIPAAGQAVTVGTSPFSYASSVKGQALVTGGTVTSMTLNRRGATYQIPAMGFVPLCKGDALTVTYTTAPTFTFLPDPR